MRSSHPRKVYECSGSMDKTLYHHTSHSNGCQLENLPNKCKRVIIYSLTDKQHYEIHDISYGSPNSSCGKTYGCLKLTKKFTIMRITCANLKFPISKLVIPKFSSF